MRRLKSAIRTLFRTPVVTAIAIVSLALGIGATAGVFSVFHQVLLQLLAVPDPSALVNLSAPGPKPGFGNCGRAGDCEVVFSYAMVDLGELPEMNAIFSEHFPADPPARTTFQCARLVADARVEIEAIAMA